MKSVLSLLVIPLLVISCVEKNNYEGIKINRADSLSIINEIPDSVQTGIPIPCSPKIVYADSVEPPVIIIPDAFPTDKAHKNIFSFLTLPSFDVSESIEDKYFNESDVAVVKSNPTKTYCIESSPVVALPMKFMESAQYDIQYLDVDEGLHSSYLWSILEDSKGQLWFASHDAGVAKFNGHQFTYYTKQQGLCENSIRFLFEDSKGNIWFASKGSGVSVYNGHYFENHTDENGLSNSQIETIFEDSQGNIWLGTDGGGVCMYDGIEFTQYSMEHGLSHMIIRSICELDNGDLWFGSYGGGITAFDGEKFSHIPNEKGSMNENIRTMVKDSNGNIWIGTIGGGVLNYNGQLFTRLTEKEGLTSNTVYSIAQDKDGDLWFGTENGLSHLRGNSITQITTDNGLRNASIRTLLCASDGNLWMGTWGGGLHRMRTNSFHHNTTSSGLPNDRITSIAQDLNGNFWFGTHRYGVAKYDGNQYEYYTRENGLSQNIVFCNYPDSKGNIWFGTFNGGISKFDGENFTNYNNNSGMNSRGVFDIVEDKNGNIIFGTNGGGVNIFDGTNFSHISEEEGLSDNIVRALEVDDDGNLWIGTWSMGLCKYDGTNITYLTTNEGLASKHIYCLEFDNRGLLWIGSDMGVDILDTKKEIIPESSLFRHYNTSSGISNNSVTAIASDHDGNIWLATKKGLNLIEFENQTDSIKTIRTFHKEDGLLSTDFYNQSIFVDSKNRLIVGSGRSLVNYHIDNLKTFPDKPKVQLFTIEINQQFLDYRHLDLDSKFPYNYQDVEPFFNYPTDLILPYNQNHLTFHFSTKHWSLNHKIKYSYQMKGLNDNWSIPSSNPIADYRNLPYGDYTFMARAAFDENSWGSPFEYKFKITPPWWHTLWARLGYVLTIIICIILYVRWRTNKLKQRQKELESEVANATHEIRQQKEEVEVQKELIEEAHKEITDSIAYAKRIQNAILPPMRIVKEYLKDSFILYKPKDIVAGDFYWMEQKEGTILFAAADCTGHGVPGAMVSVVCNNALNRSVREYGLRDPGEILDQTRKIVVAEFEKSDENVRDGMDIAICALKDNKLLYAGAHNPLWIVRNGEILETKANKQPVGKFEMTKPFTTHEIILEKGDIIYIFSDGYIDQFGGEKGKKLKSKAFKELLLNTCNKSMNEQKSIIDDAFEKWRGNLEQIDDVCVIGVRV